MLLSDFKAFIPPEHKPIHVGYDPQRKHFAFLIPTCWYLKLPMDPTQTLIDPTRAGGI